MSYSLVIQETISDMRILAPQGMNLLVARAVQYMGNKSFRVVATSERVSPNINVQISQEYALNWSPQPSAPGMQVMVAGIWTPCSLGQSYKVSRSGMWEPGSGGGNPGEFKIVNEFGQPVYPVLGVRTQGEIRPIWIAENPLLPQSNTGLSPTSDVRVWAGQSSQGTVIEDRGGSSSVEKTLSANQPWYFHLDAQTMQWQNQGNPFDG